VSSNPGWLSLTPLTGRVQVELWDCSSDSKFESCWPAICADVHALVIVFNPTSTQQATEIRAWAEYFVRETAVESPQCAIFAHGNITTAGTSFGPIKGGTAQGSGSDSGSACTSCLPTGSAPADPLSVLCVLWLSANSQEECDHSGGERQYGRRPGH
jgi:hypothetical protein